jgi:hypothetical protein
VNADPPPIPGASYTLVDPDPHAPRDPHAETPFAETFDERRRLFLAFVRGAPTPAHLSGVFHEVGRLASGGEPRADVVDAALDHIDARRDCADFVIHAILRLLLQFPDDPRLPPELWKRMRASVLGFKYWPDEPGRDSLCSWTENHQILFAGAGFLAGRLFPDETFGNSGWTGRRQRERMRPRIARWLDLRFRTGQSEWLSNVYYDEDVAALLSLVDFAGDPGIERRAAMVLDLFLLDLALHSHRGVFGSSHGRSYERSQKWAREEGTTDLCKLVFGTGSFARIENWSAVCLALSPRYRVPAVLDAVAREAAGSRFEVRQRMGIRVEEGARWGLGYASLEDGMAWLSMEAYTHPRTFRLFVKLLDAFDWWSNEFFRPFALARPLLRALSPLRLLGPVARLFEHDITRNLRPEVNLTTVRTPHTMLSSAQDWRPGYGGDQQHLWQATLGPDAVVFTTHPGPRSARSPGHWTGSASLPRVAQVGSALVCLYRIARRRPALYVKNRNGYTHAWVPRDRFDEVRETRGWLFARRGDGYLALRSRRPAHWSREGGEGEDAGREWIAPGWDNAWICEVGDRERWGRFAFFVEQVASAHLEFAGERVVYESPSEGRLEFGWEGPLRRDGEPVPLRDFPRHDAPWVQTPFPAEAVRVECDGERLELRWDEGVREASAWLDVRA